MKRLSMTLRGVVLMAMAGVIGADFSSFDLGSIDQQQGWTARDAFNTSVTIGNWDQEIQDVSGQRIFRMSNANTSNTFASQVFTPVSDQVAGESGASLWNDRGPDGTAPYNPPQYGANATTETFHTKIVFRSATGGAQPGLMITFSPSAKQSAVRMSFLRILDTGAGFDLLFLETLGNGTFPASLTTIASNLSYTDVHAIDIGMLFVDGLTTYNNTEYGNDLVQIFLNGSLIHSGTSWETYYAFNEQITAGVRRVQAVDSVLFRVVNPAVPSTYKNGFYFYDVVFNNDPIPTQFPTSAPSSLPTTSPTLRPTKKPCLFQCLKNFTEARLVCAQNYIHLEKRQCILEARIAKHDCARLARKKGCW